MGRPVVLVVDDDQQVLRALGRLVSGAGYQVRTFERPTDLLGSDLPTSEACLLVDIHLPEMTGVELCEKLAATGCALPFILMTGQSDEQTRLLAAQSQAVALLMKPFGRDLLLNAIETALRGRKHP